MSANMRIGILGGTFDPIHLGHLIIASHAADELELDRILLVPAHIPPHKESLTVSNSKDRVAMVQRAIQGDDRLVLSDHDLRQDAPSYTSELVARLSDEYPEADLHFIAGSDSLRDFPTWHDPARILRHVELAIATRPGIEVTAQILDAIPNLRARTKVFESPLVEISSTAIRDRVGAGHSIRYLVPASVEAYVHQRGLYR